MSTSTSLPPLRRGTRGLRRALASGAALVLLLAMALDTRVVRIGGAGDAQPGVFSPAAFGEAQFPKTQAAIVAKAVPAPALAAALAQDPAEASKRFGVADQGTIEIPVSFTGVAGQEESGVYDVKVEGVPADVAVKVQTGPAIMGTDLRDGTGTIGFGQFTNQIEYQNAGSALNKEMKKQVLSKIDTAALSGKTLAVVGVFQMTDPKSWLVTPVTMEVK